MVRGLPGRKRDGTWPSRKEANYFCLPMQRPWLRSCFPSDLKHTILQKWKLRHTEHGQLSNCHPPSLQVAGHSLTWHSDPSGGTWVGLYHSRGTRKHIPKKVGPSCENFVWPLSTGQSRWSKPRRTPAVHTLPPSLLPSHMCVHVPHPNATGCDKMPARPRL